METVLLNSDSKKDINLLISLAKKIGVSVKIISSKEKVVIEKVSIEESKVEKNLGKLMKEGIKSPNVSRDDIMKALK
ncbi:MAG: hypothetical protein V4548_08880 [Bacteroidota bacterium]